MRFNVNAIGRQARRVYRSPGTLRAALMASAAVPILVVLAFVIRHGGPVCTVFAGVFVIVAWRCWHWGISVSADGVRVAGLWATRSISWDEIDNFLVAPSFGYPFCAHVLLRDGRKLAALGISTAQPASEAHRRQVQGPVDELNRLLAERRGSGGGGGGQS
jgi:hypothetical protein